MIQKSFFSAVPAYKNKNKKCEGMVLNPLELYLFSLTSLKISPKEIARSFAGRNSNSLHLIPFPLFHISAARPRKVSPYTQKERGTRSSSSRLFRWVARPPLHLCLLYFFLFLSLSLCGETIALSRKSPQFYIFSPIFYSLKKKCRFLEIAIHESRRLAQQDEHFGL